MKKHAALVLSVVLALSAFAPLQANAQEGTNKGTNYEQPASQAGECPGLSTLKK